MACEEGVSREPPLTLTLSPRPGRGDGASQERSTCGLAMLSPLSPREWGEGLEFGHSKVGNVIYVWTY